MDTGLNKIQNAFSALERYSEALVEVQEDRLENPEIEVDAPKLPPSYLDCLYVASSLFQALKSAWPGTSDPVMVLPSDPGDLPRSKN